MDELMPVGATLPAAVAGNSEEGERGQRQSHRRHPSHGIRPTCQELAPWLTRIQGKGNELVYECPTDHVLVG
jgi:hypothetical protein